MNRLKSEMGYISTAKLWTIISLMTAGNMLILVFNAANIVNLMELMGDIKPLAEDIKLILKEFDKE